MDTLKKIALFLVFAVLCSSPNWAQSDASTDLTNKFVYVELQASDLAKTKVFFEHVFRWNFAEQGPTYMTFFDGRLAGGFTKSEKSSKPADGAMLISIYSRNIEETRRQIKANGGTIIQDIVGSAAGRRLIFEEPSGNQLAVVSDR